MTMQSPIFVDYYSWTKITPEIMRPKFKEFADNGVKLITMTSDMTKMILDFPEEEAMLSGMLREFGLSCRCAHGAWSDGEEMTIPFEDAEKRATMLKRIERSLECAAKLGADTCALHAESWSNQASPRPLERWMEYIQDALEQLLPVAEKNNICIALENIYGPPAMPRPLRLISEQFNSPYLGLCYDIGHAHLMSASGKKCCSWLPGIWKAYGPIPWTDETLEIMLPHIVTAHLHDNYSDTDSHDMPGKGNIDWQQKMVKLFTAPRLRTVQSEVSTQYGYSVAEVRAAFEKVLPAASMIQ